MDLIRKDRNYRRRIENEFYGSFNKFLWFSQVFGAAPVKLHLVPQLQQKFDKILSIAHLLYGFTICSAVSIATYYQHKNFDTSRDFLRSVLYMGEYIIGTFNLLLVIVGCQYQKKFYRVFYERLVNVDINLQKCGIQPNYESTRIYLTRTMFVYTVFFISVIVIDFMYNKMRGNHFVSSSTVYTVPNLVSTLALTQYSTVLHYVRDKLKTINEVLKKLITIYQNVDQKNKLSVISVLSMNTGSSGNERTLNILRKQHAELSRLTETLNECFGLLIVLILIAAYVILSIQFYAFYKMTEEFEPQDVWLTLYTILWVILHSFKVLLVLYPINNVTDEQRRTRHLLFEIDASEKSSQDTCVVKMIKKFADQLLHETAPPNALRIIYLDLTIVGTMVGVLTTYLIILIQFDVSSRDQAKIHCRTANSSQ